MEGRGETLSINQYRTKNGVLHHVRNVPVVRGEKSWRNFSSYHAGRADALVAVARRRLLACMTGIPALTDGATPPSFGAANAAVGRSAMMASAGARLSDLGDGVAAGLEFGEEALVAEEVDDGEDDEEVTVFLLLGGELFDPGEPPVDALIDHEPFEVG